MIRRKIKRKKPPLKLTPTADRIRDAADGVPNGGVTDNEMRRALRADGEPANFSKKNVPQWKLDAMEADRKAKEARKAARKQS